ncbi:MULTISPECIES: helix-turn-helix transcriptional regulator [unclassified Spirosoma]|uniref:helix-turn-helix domain-containing protein n=1 Tax=unclassified Spirosoma TaxID=2621999 RepID=UPI000959351D|nr:MULTISPECIES: helix-turn-helix transcriptional regulator [unclassified Spirosoma]MBN8823135.1 helix-turn-helix transcriptional regulator [Spirosoma sp.]OJW73390.1 MAG: hypothetical protein BGO59_06990 [Spirosoma sp. 48-14]
MIDLKIRIRKLREFAQYTQEAIAYELGITQSAYHKLENGNTRLDIDRIQQLATFYGITITDLMQKDLTELYAYLLTNSSFKDRLAKRE